MSCGTDKGYNSHRYHGEEPCGDCRRAHAARQADYVRRRELGSTARRVAACGTISGYQRHRRLQEETCPECRRAYTAYHRERRANGKSS
jgi:hypothetical protein